MKSCMEQVRELYELVIKQRQKIDALIKAINMQENSEEIFELAYSIFFQYKGGDLE